MSARRRAHTQANALQVAVTSDGTLDGTEVAVNGRPLRNVQAVDVHIGADGSDCHVTVGERVTSYGPADVDVRDLPGRLRPGPSPSDKPSRKSPSK